MRRDAHWRLLDHRQARHHAARGGDWAGDQVKALRPHVDTVVTALTTDEHDEFSYLTNPTSRRGRRDTDIVRL